MSVPALPVGAQVTVMRGSSNPEYQYPVTGTIEGFRYGVLYIPAGGYADIALIRVAADAVMYREGELTEALIAELRPAAPIALNRQQEERDQCGQRDICAACGQVASGRDPLVIAFDGYRVHLSHVLDPASGYYGEPFAAEGAAA